MTRAKTTDRLVELIEINTQALSNLRKSISCLDEVRKRIEIELVEEAYVLLSSSEKLLAKPLTEVRGSSRESKKTFKPK